ncbi:hypothetical protein C0991_007184, partial [Blastosporella zonata]
MDLLYAYGGFLATRFMVKGSIGGHKRIPGLFIASRGKIKRRLTIILATSGHSIRAATQLLGNTIQAILQLRGVVIRLPGCCKKENEPPLWNEIALAVLYAVAIKQCLPFMLGAVIQNWICDVAGLVALVAALVPSLVLRSFSNMFTSIRLQENATDVSLQDDRTLKQSPSPNWKKKLILMVDSTPIPPHHRPVSLPTPSLPSKAEAPQEIEIVLANGDACASIDDNVVGQDPDANDLNDTFSFTRLLLEPAEDLMGEQDLGLVLATVDDETVPKVENTVYKDTSLEMAEGLEEISTEVCLPGSPVVFEPPQSYVSLRFAFMITSAETLVVDSPPPDETWQEFCNKIHARYVGNKSFQKPEGITVVEPTRDDADDTFSLTDVLPDASDDNLMRKQYCMDVILGNVSEDSVTMTKVSMHEKGKAKARVCSNKVPPAEDVP